MHADRSSPANDAVGAASASFALGATTAKRTRNALAHFATNISRKIDLKSVADSCHLSPSQFCRVFRKEHGVTFSEYLMRFRIKIAIQLLSASGSIKEVAYAVGFDDPSYFSRVFRRFAGVSPTEFHSALKEARPEAAAPSLARS
jgi:AraC-like DNA-binding protein